MGDAFSVPLSSLDMTYPALVKFLVVMRVRMFAIYLFVAKLLSCFDQNYLK